MAALRRSAGVCDARELDYFIPRLSRNASLGIYYGFAAYLVVAILAFVIVEALDKTWYAAELGASFAAFAIAWIRTTLASVSVDDGAIRIGNPIRRYVFRATEVQSVYKRRVTGQVTAVRLRVVGMKRSVTALALDPKDLGAFADAIGFPLAPGEPSS